MGWLWIVVPVVLMVAMVVAMSRRGAGDPGRREDPSAAQDNLGGTSGQFGPGDGGGFGA